MGRVASQQMFSANFKKHPYRIPVIGYEENVRGWSHKKIKKYFSERYTPQNMFLVVTGDFTNKEMKKKVLENFGRFKKNKLKTKKRAKEPVQKKPNISVEVSKFEQSVSYLSWKIPGMKNKDIPALEVLSLILGYGDSSRLVHKLRIEKAVVNGISAGLFTSKDVGLLTCSLSYADENFIEALEGIRSTIIQLLLEGVTEEEIKKIVTIIESDNYYGIETVDGLSRKLGDAEFYMKDPSYYKKYLEMVKKIKPIDVLKIAKKYFAPQQMTLTSLLKKGSKDVTPIWNEWLKQYSIEYKQALIKKMSSQKIKVLNLKGKKTKNSGSEKINKKSKNSSTELQIYQLDSGVRVIFKPSEGGVLSAKGVFNGGVRVEPESLLGLVELSSRAWMGGTPQLSEPEIYQLSESIASSISPTVGRNTYGLSLDAIKPFEKESRELFLNILTEPLFPSDVIEREKLVQKEQIKNRADNPSSLVSRAFMEEIFKSHPYSRDMLGTPQSLGKIQHKEITKYWNEIALGQNLTLCLAGDVDVEDWLADIEKSTQKLGGGARIRNEFKVTPVKKEIYRFQELKKEQSHLIVGWSGLTFTDERRFTLHLIQSILAGQGGRLFIELRDKNSLAYSVSPMRMEGIDAGYFGAYIGCSPEKVGKAREMMMIEFQKLIENPVSSLEIERAQKYLIGRHDIDLQRVSSIASSILYDDVYGLPPDEAFHLKEKYYAVTPQMIQNLATETFTQPSVTSLVGPQNPFNEKGK